MARDFANRFSYSFSQGNTFRTCRRRWWLSKVAFWGGWNRNCSERSRLAYIASKMTGLYRAAGDAVHQVAAAAIRREVDSEAAALQRFREIMGKVWKDSLSGRWQADPKRVANLFEHYYEGAVRVTVIAEKAGARGRGAVAELMRSPVLATARRDDVQVLEVEDLDDVEVDGIRVFVKTDLTMRTPEAVETWDWKTGKPRAGDHEQAYLYGWSVAERQGLAVGEVRVGLGYLGTGEYEQFELDAEDVTEVRRKLVEGAEEIRSLLPDPAMNEAPEERFPRTDDLSACRWCDFFHACKGHRDLRRPDFVAAGFE